MTETICPYTGLRPFTEEESIYFKGRDEHIDQATGQLERNKFLILTGASGDGKSSLVYAGIIPNAKAGFLKSTYSNWALADFRPERTPLDNLSQSLARVLGTNAGTVRSELSHGFSALVDLYKASSLYAEEGAGDGQEKRRKAANLIVLADQFEEFFTNPENFHAGAPSQEAALVSNLLLETARFALEQGLPIYVIITMRSDFIGQCAAFRGLPEYIGFSQFFVPRLNRVQLKEVIEEPAVLSGNRIAPRLTERLIHDMAEGNDQLPILQHALNQVWKMADEGREEMDLTHYAMVGGMWGHDLPEGNAQKFNLWFEGLLAKVKECYDQPGLENVLNTHANKLYILAADYLKKEFEEEVQEEDALAIVEASFKCLTKIDSSRAVRNRMTLAEITAILNRPEIDYRKVGTVLNIFREPGNTLLRPFIDDVPELQPDSVLDITHESLIRNWERLDEWAAEEYHNLTTYQDFRQQVNRWVEHGKSGDFLLYIGPLTFFENWFKKAKPNQAWLARYVQASETGGTHLERAKTEIGNAREFLNRSARKHAITRAVMRYGPQRIAAVVGVLTVLVLGSFGIRDYLRQQNAAVLQQIKEETFNLANRNKANRQAMGLLILEQLDNGRITPDELASRVTDPIRSIELQSAAALAGMAFSKNTPAGPIDRFLTIADSLLEALDFAGSNPEEKSRALSVANEHTAVLTYIHNLRRDSFVEDLLKSNARRAGAWAEQVVTAQPAGYDNMAQVHIAINNALTFSGFDQAQIEKLVTLLSPFENRNSSDWLKQNYPKDKQYETGWFNYSLNYNGLYQQTAYLYAALGKTPEILNCIDTLLAYNQNYFERKYYYTLDNATNMAGFLYTSGHADQVKPFVDAYIRKSGDNKTQFYELLLGRSAVDERIAVSAGIGGGNYKYLSHNLNYSSVEQLAFFADLHRAAIEEETGSPDEKNYLLSLANKNAGTRIYKRIKEGGAGDPKAAAYPYFDKALEYHKLISNSYLVGMVNSLISFSDNISRRGMLFYPDFAPTVEFGDFRRGNWGCSTDGFMGYLLDKGIYREWFTYAEGPGSIEDWVWSYNNAMELSVFGVIEPSARLGELGALLSGAIPGNRNLSLAYLNLIRSAAEAGDSSSVRAYSGRLRPEDFRSMLSFAIPNRGFFYTVIFRTTARAITEASKVEGYESAYRLMSGFRKPENRAMLAAFAAKELFLDDPKSSLATRFLDSARAEMNRTDATANQNYRSHILYALALQKSEPGIAEGLALTKNVGDKVRGHLFVGSALGFQGKLYEASSRLPQETSDNNRAQYFFWVLEGLERSGQETRTQGWEACSKFYVPIFEPFFYSDENQ
jgi:energy-coupling factor transporter ATP-binding protein EcfA2